MPKFFALPCLAACALLLTDAAAHPISQGTLEIVIYPDRVVVKAGATVQEVCVEGRLLVDDNDTFPASVLTPAFAKHADYLLKHFYITVDGKVLTGKLVKTTPPEKTDAGILPLETEKEFVFYDFIYAIPHATDGAATASPKELTLKHDALNEIMYTPGVPWQEAFFTKVRQSDQTDFKTALLICNEPLEWHCEWTPVQIIDHGVERENVKSQGQQGQQGQQGNSASLVLAVLGVLGVLAVLYVLKR